MGESPTRTFRNNPGQVIFGQRTWPGVTERLQCGDETRCQAVNEELEFLRYMADKLEEARLPYMLTGSMAMMFYAVPRMTRNIDLDYLERWAGALGVLDQLRDLGRS
jgi:hypothetical protein